MKKTMTVYIEEELIVRARKRRINFSETLTNSLKQLLEGENIAFDEYFMSKYEEEKKQILSRIKRVDESKVNMSKRIDVIDEVLKKAEEIKKRHLRDEEIDKTLKAFRYQLIEMDFDLQKCEDTIEKLRGLGFSVSPEWLERYVNRLKGEYA